VSAVATETGAAVLALLEQEQAAINMTGIVSLLPDQDPAEVKRLTNDLYMQRQIGRLPVLGVRDRYYAFFALSVPTSRARPEPEEPPAPPLTVPVLALPAVLTPAEAVDVLERAGWKAEPEVVEPLPALLAERRGPDRRQLTVLEVIRRWRLPYPLARVVDLIGTRRAQLGRDEAALAIKMLREHVRGDE
jgi:hypothetical protein